MMRKRHVERQGGGSMEKKQTNLMVLSAAGVMLLLGAILIFAPQIKLYHLSYIMCGMIVIGGVYSIVRYFLSNAYQEVSDYGFSIGVLMEMIGIAGFIKTGEIVKFFPVAMSMLVLLFGVIILQDALDLKRLESALWMVDIILAAVVLVGAMVVLINPFSAEELRQTVANYLILGTGILVFVSKICLKAMIRSYDRRLSIVQKQEAEEQMEEAEETVAEETEEVEDINNLNEN